MTAMMNPAQATFVTNTNQHQDLKNTNLEQEEINGFLERPFSTQS